MREPFEFVGNRRSACRHGVPRRNAGFTVNQCALERRHGVWSSAVERRFELKRSRRIAGTIADDFLCFRAAPRGM